MRQIGRWKEAEAAYVAALGGYPPLQREPSVSQALWCHELSVVLTHRSKRQAAYLASLTACSGDEVPRDHLLQLRRLARELKQPIGVATANRGLRRLGDHRPSLLLELAEAYESLDHWARAHEALTSFLRAKPDHKAAASKALRLANLVVKWRGTYGGDLNEPHYRPISEKRLDTFRHAAVASLEHMVADQPHRIGLRSALAEARFAHRDYTGAAREYQTALDQAEGSNATWVFATKHRWQHRLEAAHAAAGAPRVEDPHFQCFVEHSDDGTSVEAGSVPGLFTAKFTYSGLHVSGRVGDGDDVVVILLDTMVLRRVNVDPSREFVYIVGRDSLPGFPARGKLRVTTSSGASLIAAGGGTTLTLNVPHGEGSVVPHLKAGGNLDKKGAVAPSDNEVKGTHGEFLTMYGRVRDFFDTELGKPLFTVYGTLLGFHRDNGFIPGDDDFDCAWLTDAGTPQEAKEEAMNVMVELVKAGFVVSFNRRGRLFRVATPGKAAHLHLDVHPVWLNSGNAWLHNNCRMEADRDTFLPVKTKRVNGVDVLLPADACRFLRHHYGPGWDTPDPGFMYYLDSTEESIMSELSKALITPEEYRRLGERIVSETGDENARQRLQSVGSPDFYPLTTFAP